MQARLQRWLRSCPLMALAAAGCAGIILAEYDVAHIQAWGMPAAMVLLLLALLLRRPWMALAGACMAFAVLHIENLGQTYHHPLRLALLEHGKALPATIEGSLTPDHCAAWPGRERAMCAVTRVTFDGGAGWPMEARVRLSLPDGKAFPGSGIYRLSGLLRLPGGRDAPGTFDPADHALRTGITAEMRVGEMAALPGRGAVLTCALLDAAEACRQWISEQLSLDLENDPRIAGVIRAMALGVVDEAQDDIEIAFRDSGTLHVFAVSGLHVALLGLIAWQVLKVFGLRGGPALVVMLVIVFAYAFVTGWRASAARAAMMVAVVFCGPSTDRDSSVQNNLGLAALLLLGWDTHQLFMPGFQLSFGVLWAIAALSGTFMSPLSDWMNLDPLLPVEFATRWHLAALGFRRWLLGNLCVSAAAWLGSLPFILMHFQAVTPVALIANCVLVPLSIAALAVTCTSILAALLHLTGAQIAINNVNWLLAKMMIASAAWFASLPGANFHLQPQAEPRPASMITWRVLPVPDGGAANHLHIGEEHWLLDTGPAEKFRPLLHPYLRHQGVNRIRGIVLSHNDAAHIGAVEEVSALFGGPELFCSHREPGPYDSAHTLIRRIEETQRLKRLRNGDVLPLGPEGSLACLHPSAESRSMRGDDRAMVAMAKLHHFRLLWASDAGWLTENALVDSGDDLRCDVLLVSGHATDASGTDGFLQKASPRLIIRGSQPARRDGPPPLDQLSEWCARHSVPLWHAADNGSIAIDITPEGLRARGDAQPRELQLAPASY